MAYTFLVKNFDDEKRYFAIPSDKLETLRLSKTYNEFGQQVGTYDMGDSIELKSEKAVELANKIAKEQDESYHFVEADMVNGYEHSDIFDLVEDAFKDVGLKSGEDYMLYAEEAQGFDYIDGANYHTVTVSQDHGEPGYKEVEDEELVKELNEAIENMAFDHKLHGITVYRSGDWKIESSQYAGSWESYSITDWED